jgi:hypothetical protein
MGAVIAPPGSPDASGTSTEQAIFIAARGGRRGRWLAGIAVLAAAAAAVAVSAVTWLPGAPGQPAANAGAARAAGTAATGHAPAWQAKISYRVMTAGILEAYGNQDIRYSGKNWDSSSFQRMTARGPSPSLITSVVERSVAGKAYYYSRAGGRMRWVASAFAAPAPVRVRDPRTLLSQMRPFTPFRVAGHQVIGGVRLTVLRATDPAGLTRHGLLPVMYTSGQPVTSLTVWADQQGVVHRLAFTFSAPGVIALTTPVSQAALRKYHRAENFLPRLQRAGQPISPGLAHRAAVRELAAGLHAYQVRRGAQVTTTTVTFLAIGQRYRIGRPTDLLPYRAWLRLAGHH